MKRSIILTFVLLALVSSCTKYEEHPLRPVSFEIGGKLYYSAKDTQVEGNIFGDNPAPEIMTIRQYGDTLDIAYTRSTDFLNYDLNGLGLCIRKMAARFEEGTRMEFVAQDDIQGYEKYFSLPYVHMNPIRSSSASDQDVYVATRGWIEFDEVDFVHNTVSGRFEFDALLDDDGECGHPAEIEVRNGSFRNIPYEFSSQE